MHHKLSMNELSKLMGISRTSLRPLYNGKAKAIKYKTMERLVNFFGIPVSKLFKVIPTLSIHLSNGFPNIPKLMLDNKKSPNTKKYRAKSNKFMKKVNKVPISKVTAKMNKSTLLSLKSGKRTGYFVIYPKFLGKHTLSGNSSQHKHLITTSKYLGKLGITLNYNSQPKQTYGFFLIFTPIFTNETSKRILFNQFIKGLSDNKVLIEYITARLLSHSGNISPSVIHSFKNKGSDLIALPVFPNDIEFSHKLNDLMISSSLSSHLNYFFHNKNMIFRGVHLSDSTTNNFR